MNTIAAEPLRGQAIALAAVVQAALLVDQLARQGAASAEEMQRLSQSLFRLEWEHPAEVFGGLMALRRGLAGLEEILKAGSTTTNPAALRYALALLRLGRQLGSDQGRMTTIRARLDHAAIKQEHFASRFDETASSLASIYQDCVSNMRYRIQVNGSAQHLQDARVAERIRALLLCGLRAAIMWRHLGGRRLQLLTARGRLLTAVSALHAVSSTH